MKVDGDANVMSWTARLRVLNSIGSNGEGRHTPAECKVDDRERSAGLAADQMRLKVVGRADIIIARLVRSCLGSLRESE